MQISFHGAAGEVTGSCILVETKTNKFLVDCGMFQGSQFAREENFEAWPFDPVSIDFLLLTHAHVDHCGRLPKLYADGFRGRVYCTPATRDLTEIILLDAATGAYRLVVQAGAALRFVDFCPLGVDRRGKSGARAGAVGG